jgi:hypothetical protein
LFLFIFQKTFTCLFSNSNSKTQTNSELKDELPRNFYKLVDSNKSKDTAYKENQNQDIVDRLEKLNEKPADKRNNFF